MTDKRKRELIHELVDAVLDYSEFKTAEGGPDKERVIQFRLDTRFADIQVNWFNCDYSRKKGVFIEKGREINSYIPRNTEFPERVCTEENFRNLINEVKESEKTVI